MFVVSGRFLLVTQLVLCLVQDFNVGDCDFSIVSWPILSFLLCSSHHRENLGRCQETIEKPEILKVRDKVMSYWVTLMSSAELTGSGVSSPCCCI